MSNHLAVATVTTALQRVLNAAVMADVNGATATAVRPDTAQAALPAKGVNVFLYQVTPNGGLRNVDMPTRRGTGGPAARPTAAIDLHYLLSFYGDETTLDAQRVLGSVVRQLHSVPYLTRQAIADAVTASSWLTGSDLVDQVDLVKLSPVTLTLDDLSKLWSILFQTVYVPSVVYLASVVLIEADVPARQSFPVRSVGPLARPVPDARLDLVDPPRVPFSANASVGLVGRSLLGAARRYLFSGLEGTLVAAGSTDDRAVVRLPAGLPAGPVLASVRDEEPLGAGHTGFETSPVVFLLLPGVTSHAFASDPGPRPDPRLVLTPAPPADARQRVDLVLNDPTTGDSFVLPARPRASDGDDCVFGLAGVPAGTYLYRVRVDGAESPLELDTTDPDPANQPYVGPTVVVP